MNGELDPLVGVSLDSVVQKAADLSAILQTCKHSLEDKPPPSSWGRAHSWSPSTDNRLESPVALLGKFQYPESSPSPSNAVLMENWQQLTSYIVSLEKEVQCYKQLIEEVHKTADKPASTDENARPHSPALQAETDKEQQYWDRIIEEDQFNQVLLLVFSHLSTEELCAVSRVCKKWHTITRHPKLWKTVSMSETVLQPKVLARLSKHCTQTEKLYLHGLMPPMTDCDEDLSSYITRTRGSLEDAVETIMMNSKNTLASITLTECNLMVTERILWLISIHCHNLKSLSYCSDEFPPSGESLWSLSNGCKQIQHLNLPPLLASPNQSAFNDNALKVIAYGWPNLVSLTVGGKAITTEGLTEISHGCPKLCFLEVIHGPDFDKDSVEVLCENNGFASLRSIVLNFTPSTHIAMIALIEYCQLLVKVDLHVTLYNYFSSDDASDPENIAAYEKVIRNLKRLERHSKGRNIFHLFEHYTKS